MQVLTRALVSVEAVAHDMITSPVLGFWPLVSRSLIPAISPASATCLSLLRLSIQSLSIQTAVAVGGWRERGARIQVKATRALVRVEATLDYTSLHQE